MEKLRIKMCVEEGRYEEALQISVDWTPSEVNRAHIRLSAKYREYAGVRELLNRAKGRLINESVLERGRRYSCIGFKERATALLVKALEQGGEPDDFLLVGQLLEQLRPIEYALEYFETAVRLRGDAADRLWLGTAYERLSRIEDAMAQYNKAILLRGAAADYLAKGTLLYRFKKFDEAEPILQIAASLGERIAATQILQGIKTARGRDRIKRLLSGIAGFLSGEQKEAEVKRPEGAMKGRIENGRNGH